MGATFETIPPEPVKAIVCWLDRSSWKALRLVNKAFASHVTPLLFRDIEVWIQTQSLSNLLSIARSNNLAPHVQTLTITNDYLHTLILSPRSMISAIYLGIFNPRGTSRGPGWIDAAAAQDVSLESFDASDIPEKLRSLGWDRERIFKTWTRQKELVMEQDELIRNSRDIEYLAKALGSLLNLSCIKLTCDGIGAARKISLSQKKEVFFRGPTSRSDRRQLFSFFRAAAATSASNPSQNPKLAKLIMDKKFWEGEYYWLPGQYRPPLDFGDLDLSTLTSALPLLRAITTLEIQAQYQKDNQDIPLIERNLIALLSGMPNLQNLTLHNPYRAIPLRLHTPINAITSTSCRSLNLQHCILHMPSMLEFLTKQARTLKILRLEMISLVGAGHVIDFFTSIRALLSLDTFSLKGWIVEVNDDTLTYSPEEEIENETFYEVKERRIAAREAIEMFVRRETDVFPTELLDIDSSGFTDLSDGTRDGLIVVLGASQFFDTNEVDY